MLNTLLTALLLILSFGSSVHTQTLFPRNGASMVNPDVQLKLSVKSIPRVGTSGTIRIVDAESGRVVDTLDMSIPPGPTKPVDPAVRAKNYLAFSYPYDRASRPTNRNAKPGTPSAGAATTSNQYQLTIIGGNQDGSLVDVSRRVSWSRQLDKIKDAKLIADYSNPEFVFSGWKPNSEFR
jgi:hypothetical protein